LLWLLVILSLPLVGALLYLLFGNKRTARPLKRRLQQVQKSCNPQPLPIKEAPFDGEKRMGQTVRWLEEKTQYPMCAVEQVRYYPLGDNMFPDMLADLKNARNSIYVEYFIIEPGHMWDAIVNELEIKMEQGVDVRVIYDDLGSISSFNFSNVRELKKKGIPCIPFNPFLALKGTANYRDHRKMLIIDNEVAYSGDQLIRSVYQFGTSLWTLEGHRLSDYW
jgi:cardiolipin synthase